MPVCARCGKEAEEDARFCPACGAPLDAEPAREVRKTVTLLFADMTGSTVLGERLDPESLRREVLRLSGRTGEAVAAAERALALYERKGIIPLVERTRALIAELSASS